MSAAKGPISSRRSRTSIHVPSPTSIHWRRRTSARFSALRLGHSRTLRETGWTPVRWLVGDWTVSGLLHVDDGYPSLPTIADTNRLSGPDQTHTVRPDLVPGAPLINPLWRRDCPIGTLCEPYINPAAFMRPLKGQLGNAPRTLDVRGPIERFIDLSFQKNFALGASSRRIQFRVDMINAFNHPNFRLSSRNSGTDLLASLP